jgi:DNA-binding NarL/FixJ family response regulator
LAAEPIVAALAGPQSLAMDIARHVLGDAGITVIDHGEAVQAHADAVMLVEPLPEHWSAVRTQAAPVVLLAPEEPDVSDVVTAVLAGADAVVTLESSAEQVVTAVTEVSRGGTVLAPAHVRALAGVARLAVAQPGVVLTRREREILSSIARGESVKQTARSLAIAAKTVENLQSRLFRKLCVRNRAQAVARAHQIGLL